MNLNKGNSSLEKIVHDIGRHILYIYIIKIFKINK